MYVLTHRIDKNQNIENGNFLLSDLTDFNPWASDSTQV